MKSTSCGAKQTCFWVIMLTFSVTNTRNEDCNIDEYLHETDKYSRNEPDTKISTETSSNTPCQLSSFSSSSKNVNCEDDIDDNSRVNHQRSVLVASFSDWHFSERQLLIGKRSFTSSSGQVL